MHVNINAKITPGKVLAHLQSRHLGRDNGIHVSALARNILKGSPTAADERSVRFAVAALREDGHPICAHPNDGYFYAKNSGEINETCEFLYARAMHSLKQIAALKRKSLPEIRGQLGLDV